MMFTSPAFPFIVFVCMGLTDVAHSYDALPLIRKSREVVKEHPNTSANGFPGYRRGIVALAPAPTIAARKPINVAGPAATTIQPPTAEPNTPFLSHSIYTAAFGRRKLNSVDVKTSRMSDNKAERPGVVPNLSTTSDNSQGEYNAQIKCNSPMYSIRFICR